MIELFQNIRPEVKKTAEAAWYLATLQKDGIKAIDFLNDVTNYYRNIYTQEEIEFLQFYFKMNMEKVIE